MTPDFTTPPEWTPHEAVWLAWPSHRTEWGASLAAVRREFQALCRAIADPDPVAGTPSGETLHVLALDVPGQTAAEAALAGLGATIHIAPFGDIWLRDTAPVFNRDAAGRPVAQCFRFNGWGGKFKLAGDERVARWIADASGAARVDHDLVLEGGSVDFDGQGTVLTTRSCLLNANRNPGRSEAEVEAQLRRAFGVVHVVWLTRGLENDHTDGHVDTLARFVAPGRVVCMAPSGHDDPNTGVLRALQSELAKATDAGGQRLDVVTIPSPGRIVDANGKVLPASYVNFYIGNTTVVVPTYGSPFDDAAVEAIAVLFPGRRVVGASARRILEGGGAFHCVTQQQPVSPT